MEWFHHNAFNGKKETTMNVDKLFETFNVNPASSRAAVLKKLADGKPVKLSDDQVGAIPYLRARAKQNKMYIDLVDGKYVLKSGTAPVAAKKVAKKAPAKKAVAKKAAKKAA